MRDVEYVVHFVGAQRGDCRRGRGLGYLYQEPQACIEERAQGCVTEAHQRCVDGASSYHSSEWWAVDNTWGERSVICWVADGWLRGGGEKCLWGRRQLQFGAFSPEKQRELTDIAWSCRSEAFLLRSSFWYARFFRSFIYYCFHFSYMHLRSLPFSLCGHRHYILVFDALIFFDTLCNFKYSLFHMVSVYNQSARIDVMDNGARCLQLSYTFLLIASISLS